MSEDLKEKMKRLQRPLDISDIDFRVQSINKGGYATILAYKDARVDMNRLDEVFGIGYWQRDVKFINGVLYGGVAIHNSELNEWIWKWDAGAESFSDKEKGQSSDAFKRACFNLGIGRELYNYPVIQVKLKSNEFEVDNNGRARQTFGLKLKQWRWASQFKNGELTFLYAKDENDEIRFKWGEYDKSLDVKEVLASGSDNVDPHAHEKESDTPIVRGTTDEEEAGNVSNLTKKVAEPVELNPDKGKEKIPTEEEVKWNELAQKYTIIFGKEPRANMKLETLQQKIDEETARKEAEKNASKPAYQYDEAEEVDEEEPVDSTSEDPYSKVSDSIEEAEEEEPMDVFEEEKTEEAPALSILEKYIAEITTFKDKKLFVDWAKAAVSALTGKFTEEEIAKFKKQCNKHYETL